MVSIWNIGEELPLRLNKKESDTVEKTEISPGDHIYTYRGACGVLFTHHGIYVGENKVVHYRAMRKEYLGIISVKNNGKLSCGNSDCGSSELNSGVVLNCLDCFLRHGSLYRYKYGVTGLDFLFTERAGTCTIALPDLPEIVVHRAKYLLKNGFGNYNVFRNNCEDFALYCKTELWIMNWDRVGRSGQVWTANIRLFVNYVVGNNGFGFSEKIPKIFRSFIFDIFPKYSDCFSNYSTSVT